MKNRTFCILLAGFLMLLSGLTVIFAKDKGNVESVQDAASSVVEEEMEPPLKGGEIVRNYGAEYSELYRQWTMSDEVVLMPGADKNIYAPVRGKIESIEKTDAGGCVAIQADGLLIEMHPVIGLRVFEGSAVERGDILGEVDGLLTVRAERGGISEDPLTLWGQIYAPIGEATGSNR